MIRINNRRWWITTDTHFGHKNLIEWGQRPEDFSEKIIKSWKQNVKPDDWIIHLGDVSWPAYYNELINLPGHKILCRGNHDIKSYNWYNKRGFDLVCEEYTMKYDGMNILFSHQPRIFHDKDINIHGHLHNMSHRTYHDFNINGQPISPLYCVSLERLGYEVFSLDYIMKLTRKEMQKGEKDG